LKAATIYAGDDNDRLPDPPNECDSSRRRNAGIPAVAGILAKNNILTDPSFYFAKNDPLYPATVPTVILACRCRSPQSDGHDIHSLNSVALEFVGGVQMSDAATTPVVLHAWPSDSRHSERHHKCHRISAYIKTPAAISHFSVAT